VRDRALVERFQEGDPAAFETLYRRYFARLARFCQKRVGDPHEAEEIAQEAFARALRALPTFEGERRFYPWMTVIAGRLCIDAHRRRGRSEPSSQIDLGVIEGGQEKIVDEVDVQILATALGRIAPRHREVLDLREQQGWSYQEIADHYEVTLGTVEALLFRARKALKREFLAVVGGDRNWAGIPVLGAAFGKVAAAKARIEAWASGVVPALSGPAVAAAIAVTAVTGAAVGGGMLLDDDGQGRPTDVVRMAAAPAAAVTTTSLPELLGGVTEETVQAAHTHPASAPATENPTVDDVVGGAASSATVHGYDERDEAVKDHPIEVEPVPGEFTAVDPSATTTDVANKIALYIAQLGEQP
jgi:RNA polymerase sigma-70 factor, ECF subfamily